MSEAIYEKLGATNSIHNEPWPKYDENLAKQSDITFILQINGKIRDKVEVAVDTPKEDLEKLALNNEKIKQALEGKTVVKTIIVPNKLANIVVK